MTLADARTDYYRRDENSDDHSLDRYFDDVDFVHGSSSSILNRRSVKMYPKAARTGEDSPLIDVDQAPQYNKERKVVSGRLRNGFCARGAKSLENRKECFRVGEKSVSCATQLAYSMTSRLRHVRYHHVHCGENRECIYIYINAFGCAVVSTNSPALNAAIS